MIKKNLIILLLIPFLIALVGVMAAKSTYKLIDDDIRDIKWNYGDVEAFKVNNSILLEAEGVSSGDVNDENKLTWTIENKNKDDEEIHAEIKEENGNFYLNTLSVGNVIITCSNKKGNIYRSMNAIIYEHGAILVSSEIQSSQQSIDSTTYYGEYDLIDGRKQKASFNLNVRVVPEQYKDNLYVKSTSSNVNFNLKDKVVEIKAKTETIRNCNLSPEFINVELSAWLFLVISDGPNVTSINECCPVQFPEEMCAILDIQIQFDITCLVNEINITIRALETTRTKLTNTPASNTIGATAEIPLLIGENGRIAIRTGDT